MSEGFTHYLVPAGELEGLVKLFVRQKIRGHEKRKEKQVLTVALLAQYPKVCVRQPKVEEEPE